MTFYQVPAPDLSGLTSAGATLHLLEPFGYSNDDRLLLVRATYTELGASDLRYAFFVFDLESQDFIANINVMLSGDANVDAIDVVDAAIIGDQNSWTVIARVETLGETNSVLQSVASNGSIVSDVTSSNLGLSIQVEVTNFKISGDGRYIAIETRGEQLASDLIPDTNDQTEDVYLIDTQTKSVLRVSLAGGAEVQDPVYLQDLKVASDGLIQISLLTAAALVNPNIDSNSLNLNSPLGSRDDTYLWSVASDESGWTGVPAIDLVSKDITGSASGYVTDDYGPSVITDLGVMYSSDAPELIGSDGNSAVDVFLNDGFSTVRLTEISGEEFNSGGTLLSASESGESLVVLTDSDEFGGVEGLSQIVLINTLDGTAEVVSSNGNQANNIAINGLLSHSGYTLAFTSLASNLVSDASVTTSGDLFINQSAIPLDGKIYHWSNHALLSGVTIDVTQVLSSGDIDIFATSQTGLIGDYGLTVPFLNQVTLAPSLAFDPSDRRSAITSADALAALKIAVGLNPNADPDGAGPLNAAEVSPYQYIASDVNKDGRITSADALATLKMAVGLSSALQPEWLFVAQGQTFWLDDGTDGYTLDSNNVDWQLGLLLDGAAPDDLDFVAVLLGDVNGSWQAPNDATILPDDYFRQLEQDGYGPAGKWDVVPIP